MPVGIMIIVILIFTSVFFAKKSIKNRKDKEKEKLIFSDETPKEKK
ncbi:UNVERIFIED_CONTAM: hypothetical protein O8I53_07685 [Campylobacter lari]